MKKYLNNIKTRLFGNYFANLCEKHANALYAAGDFRGAVGAFECAELIRKNNHDRNTFLESNGRLNHDV